MLDALTARDGVRLRPAAPSHLAHKTAAVLDGLQTARQEGGVNAPEKVAMTPAIRCRRLHPCACIERRRRFCAGRPRSEVRSRRGAVRRGRAAATATDASIYQIDPVGVVVPQTRRTSSRRIDLAARCGVPVLPRGGGTSQCGQTVGEALVIDNSRHLNQVVEFDAEARTALEVQPGMVLDHLNAF
jgi:hypothetical protein